MIKVIKGQAFRDKVLDAAEELTGTRYYKKDGELMIDAVFLAIEKALVSGEEVDLRGFGRFRIHTYAPRRLVGLYGEDIQIAPYNGVKFVPGQRLKREVAQGIIRPVERGRS